MPNNNSNNVCQEQTFERLFTSHSKQVYNYIYYKCGNEEKANDVVQEAFIKLWENCAKVTIEKAKAFVYKVANNLFLNTIKAEKVALKYAPEQNEVSNISPQFVLEEKEYHQKLERAINSLTEAQRTAFLLNRIDGMKYKEIAEALNISVKAVEKRIHGALQSLRKEIDGI